MLWCIFGSGPAVRALPFHDVPARPLSPLQVRFTRATEEEQSTSDKVLYVDPLTKETFTNASRLVALKPTGDVLLEQTYR